MYIFNLFAKARNIYGIIILSNYSAVRFAGGGGQGFTAPHHANNRPDRAA